MNKTNAANSNLPMNDIARAGRLKRLSEIEFDGVIGKAETNRNGLKYFQFNRV